MITNGSPDEDAINEILSLCKKGNGDKTITLNATPLTAADLPVDPGEGESISLIRLEDVVGVNQLAANQTLNFEPKGLTLIYGPNGSGKSGYTRILKKACRARHAGEIMPDIYKPSPSGNGRLIYVCPMQKTKKRLWVGKTAVVGVKDRETNQVRAKVVAHTDKETLQGFVKDNTSDNAFIYTDEAHAYRGLIHHKSVKHSLGEYVNDQIHTNGMESFWAVMKRGFYGTYHRMSPKHLQRYVYEFAGRCNSRSKDTLGNPPEKESLL